jgi:hypothetical protein
MPEDVEPFPVDVIVLIPSENDGVALRTDLTSLVLDLFKAIDRQRTHEPQLDVRVLGDFSAAELLSTEAFPIGGS